MPGTGAKTEARILIEAGDRIPFPITGHLAAYARIAPATWSSGSAICGEQPSREGKQADQTGTISLCVRRLSDPASRIC
ncbi:transposase [Streptomyces sp. NPDC057367]|uniref:transposase n=1 Tax=Streptomyces sp. NPDC057367 TaxID=3346108 RepID=UPI00363A6648